MTNRVDASLSDEGEYKMHNIGDHGSARMAKPIEVELRLNGVPTTMEVDTGASVSIVSEDLFKTLKAEGAPHERSCSPIRAQQSNFQPPTGGD